MTLYKRSTTASRPVVSRLLYRCPTCGHVEVRKTKASGGLFCKKDGAAMDLVEANAGAEDGSEAGT